MTTSSPSIKRKGSQNHRQKDKVESDLEQADEIMDDSASSYYTALCSLSEYSEDIDDRTSIEPLESQDCATSMEGITSTSLIKDTTQEYKTQKDMDTTELPEVSQGQQDESSSLKMDLLESESKPLLSSTTSTNTDLQSLKADAIQKLDTSFNFSQKDLSLRPKDYFRGTGTIFHTNIRSAEELSYSQHGSTSNTILPSPDRDQYSKGRKPEHGGTEPKEGHATQQQRPNESWFFRGGHILGNMVTEGEGQGTRNEQAELSLRSRNRKGSASCISTFTGSKQESRIPSHYSECISAPGQQHQLQNLADTWSLKKQSTKGAWLSRSVSNKQCSTLWQPCHNTSMGTKLAEASGNLAQVRSSCTEPDYLHVFGSCCRPSHQLSSDGSNNNWKDDILSFKMQMYSNTSACSESSSFECIDVAVESTEEIKRGLKTVPKRQIQLKRRDVAESLVRENNDESLQVPNPPMRTRDLFQRQHSMPEAFHQESHATDQRSIQAERKQKLQKSFSLDETSGKTKMASCIITSVLSKKMQHEQNLRTMDVADTSVDANDLHSATKDVHAEITKLQQSTLPQTAPPKIEAQAECSSIQRHNIANSKTQPKPLSKHSFNPLLIGIERSEIQGSGTEITVPSENEKAEKPISREEVVRLPNLSPGPKLSCDSAKSRAWTSSAATNVPISAQASVKTTPEECHMGQRIHQGGSIESTLSPTNIACLISDLEANETVPLVDEGAVGEGQESVKLLGQFTCPGVQSQGKMKAMAPMHVVRDMRSLVKNTYNLPFKGPVESVHSSTPFHHNQTNIKNEDKGKLHRQDEKPLVQKDSPPIPLDKMRDLAFHHFTPRGCSTKLMPPVESNDKSHTVGFTKVSQTSVTKANSCAMSKPPGIQDSQFGFCKGGIAGNETNLKPTNRKDLTPQTGEDCSTEAPMKQEFNSSDNDRQAAFHSFPVPMQYYSPTVSAEQQYHSRMISDGQCVPPRSQSSAGPLSACVLTVASTPMVQHPCYFNANPLGYQTISPHIGYVQGPVLFQAPLYNQPPASNSNISLSRSLSEDGKMQQSPTDGSTNHSEESILNTPSPDGIQNTVFVAPLPAEARLGGTGVLCPDAGGSQNQRQLLVDPETGRCFYVDVPQLPQRKMLFDPQTCQYVEVLLPQQTLNSAVLPSPCPIPFASVHIPPMYTTHCLPFVQAHPQVLQPPGP
nr:uncharacterized protein prob1 [Misgurnus anguillicaudatus]